MNEEKREVLLGYILGSLEDDEIHRVGRELKNNDLLQAEYLDLRNELKPLRLIDAAFDQPDGLAEKTCDKIWHLIENTPKSELHKYEDHDCLNPILDDSHLASTASPKRRTLGRISRRQSSSSQKSAKTRPVYNILTYITLGVMFVLFAFPLGRFFLNQAVTIIANNRIRQIENDINIPSSNLLPDLVVRESTENTNEIYKVNDNSKFVNVDTKIRDSILNNNGSNPSVLLVNALEIKNPQEMIPGPPAKDFFVDVTGDNQLRARDEKTQNNLPIETEIHKILVSSPKKSETLDRINAVFFSLGSNKTNDGPPFLHSASSRSVIFRDGYVFFRVVPANALQPAIYTKENINSTKIPIFFSPVPLSQSENSENNNFE